MLTHRTIPAEWQVLLRDIRAVAPEAFLAGGALRDLDNGRVIKDLDVFLSTDADMADVMTAMRKHGYTTVGSDLSLREDYGSLGVGVTGILELRHSDPGVPPLNFIRVEDATVDAQINRFDFGICQIAYDGETVSRTMAYLLDQDAHTFTIIRRDDGDERALRRWERLRQKYEGWSLITP